MKKEFFTNKASSKSVAPIYSNLFDVKGLFRTNKRVNDQKFIDYLNESISFVDMDLLKYKFNIGISIDEDNLKLVDFFYNKKEKFRTNEVSISFFDKENNIKLVIDFFDCALDNLEFPKVEYGENCLLTLTSVWGFRKYKIRVVND